VTAKPSMQRAVKLAVVLLLALGAAAWASQDPGSTAGSPSPAPATQNESETKSNEAQPESVEKPAPPADSASPVSTVRKRRSRVSKPAEAPVVEREPRKIVINRGGVSEPVMQIIPGMTLEESNRQREDARDLLAAADSDLKKLTDRNLDSNQQKTVSQIRHYMDVARAALSDGDIQRAHTLAQKAQLLSDDLVKH